MTIKLSSKGQVALPANVRRRLALSPGDSFEVTVPTSGEQAGNVILSPRKKRRPEMKIIKDPLTGWSVLKAAPGTSIKISSAIVKKMLADFP